MSSIEWLADEERTQVERTVVGFRGGTAPDDGRKHPIWRATRLSEKEPVFDVNCEIHCYACLTGKCVQRNLFYIIFSSKGLTHDFIFSIMIIILSGMREDILIKEK